MQRFCPKCEAVREVTLKKRVEKHRLRKEEITIQAEVLKCQVCEEEFASTEIEEKNFKALYDLYRTKHNYLFPNDIASIRKKYGLSQRALSRLLGWGVITIYNYEAGALQDEAHNSVLKLIQSPKNMYHLYTANRGNLSKSEVVKLEGRLEELVRTEDDQEYQQLWEKKFCNYEMGLNTGNRPFDFDKFQNTVLWVIKENNGIWKTKLLKLLFYSDFLYFRKCGLSITGAQYVHIDLGPVPDNWGEYLEKMIKDKQIMREFRVIPNANCPGEKLRLGIEPDMNAFSPYELKCIRFVCQFFKRYSASQICKYIHKKEEAFKQTGHQEIISYEYAKTLSIPDFD